ncbi:hypothetical protein, partial [Streptomyces sp. NPDC058731]|uniref:hypothetical protein n=1 Tax=Streptomyces sp. NPDC058731 TaxID=3346613 RepID=UPI00369CEA05
LGLGAPDRAVDLRGVVDSVGGALAYRPSPRPHLRRVRGAPHEPAMVTSWVNYALSGGSWPFTGLPSRGNMTETVFVRQLCQRLLAPLT